MGALTIAFDTTIVGALALPWVLLFIHLFFFQGENPLERLVNLVKERQLQTVAGVLLFAMAFTLGSAVSRIAQDFFNDDDLHVPWVLRMAMTEDRIIASVACNTDHYHLLNAAAASPTLADKIKTFECLKSNCCQPDGSALPNAGTAPHEGKGDSQSQKQDCCMDEGSDTPPAGTSNPAPGKTSLPQEPACLCQRILSPRGRYTRGRYMSSTDREKEDDLIKSARDIFGLEENALLLKGEDATLRLRQLHDQIMVLRGATFDGLISFALCLFAWGVRARREKPRSAVRWVLALIPAVLLFLAVDATVHHYQERFIAEPPYMEFSLFIVGAAGGILLWTRLVQTSEGSKERQCIRWPWPAMSLLFAVLSVAGILGWWSTEVLYGEQVIYSYDSQGAGTQK